MRRIKRILLAPIISAEETVAWRDSRVRRYSPARKSRAVPAAGGRPTTPASVVDTPT
jgi:hypothetical protein